MVELKKNGVPIPLRFKHRVQNLKNFGKKYIYRHGQIKTYSRFLQFCKNDNIGSKFEVNALN